MQVASGPAHQLLNPVPEAEVVRLAGQTVTVGGWMWAERASTPVELGLVWSPAGQTRLRILGTPVELSTTSTFYAYSVAIPDDVGKLYYALIARVSSSRRTPQALVYLDGAVIVQGEQSAETVPTYADDDASRGMWNGAKLSATWSAMPRASRPGHVSGHGSPH